MKQTLFFFLFIFSLSTYACVDDGTGGFVEENDMNIPVGAKTGGGLTQAQFNAVIDKIEPIYQKIISDMGGKLKIYRKWSDGTVNASARRSLILRQWEVNMFGGLARHATITPDGFALVLCHEIGHHIGGAPKYDSFMNRWASNEGQSDYFAVSKCLRRAFWNDDNAAVISRMKIPNSLVMACNKTNKNRDDYSLCVRTAMAGMSVANLFASMRSKPGPQFETPDRSKVSTTNHSHPDYQCRLDTYFQAALCEVDYRENVSQSNEVTGTCHGANGHRIGLRPACWFKPTK
jgi:hypothetical protein